MILKLAAIEIKPSHEGLLHKNLGIPKGEKIPLEELKSRLANTTDPKVRKRLQFAINARKWRH